MFLNLAPGGSVSGSEFEIPIFSDMGHPAISKCRNRGGGVFLSQKSVCSRPKQIDKTLFLIIQLFLDNVQYSYDTGQHGFIDTFTATKH